MTTIEKPSPTQRIIIMLIRRHQNKIDMLERQLSAAGDPPSLPMIMSISAKVCGVTVAQIKSQNRLPRLVNCRRIIAVQARRYGYTLQQIGDSMGDRHHTTIMHLVQTFNNLALNEPNIRTLTSRVVRKLGSA